MESPYEIIEQSNALAFVIFKKEKDDERTVIAMLYYDFGIDKTIIHELAKSYVKRLVEKGIMA